MINKELHSERAPPAVGAYPHARQVGDFLFLSGVGPRVKDSDSIPGVELDENGNIISYDIAEQCRSVFNNVKIILEDCGSSLENIIDITVFLTNMNADFPIFNNLYRETFGKIKPCRTTVEVNALPTPIAIELKVQAIID